MTIRSHLIVDESGTILSIDTAFAELMRIEPARLVGAYILEITVPVHRRTCLSLFDRLRSHGTAFTTVKQFIRGDGTHVWARSAGSLSNDAASAGGRRFAFAVEECDPPTHWLEPGRMLALARLILAGRRQRTATFGMHFFPDHAWEIVLEAYIAEAEGRIFSIADLHADSGLTLTTASRWLRALADDGLLEYERRDAEQLVTSPIRLSTAGHRQFEDYLRTLFANADDAEAALVS